ncbi:uncharacterized protein LOC127701291 [Mytilus californianus]|uniref:uncharacterized protein LOC127701291 n=1 Tax=Mytilus californianus TaxID=6549 RepID=UPI002246A978|nr:uncharacterized protein LOC127701291 [Mytilus californianus]XP_052061120.1 uncharacterized protein LOC127701291 [Mytilus californianus]
MSTSSTCVEHTSEEIRFFCEECHVFVCDDCVSGQGKHIRCTKVKLSEYGNKNKLCLIENVEEITSKKLPHINKTLELAKNVKGSFNKSMDENIADFRSKTQKIKAIIDELQEETIRELEESRLKANVKFDEFISFHQKRYSKLAHVTEEIQQQKADIQPSDVVKYDFELNKNLNTEHDSETIPKLEPSRFEIAQQYLKKEFYQDIFLCKQTKEDAKTESNTNKLETEERNSSPDYLEPVSHAREINLGCTVNEKIIIKNYEENSSDIYVSKSGNKGASAIYNKDLNYKTIKKFECKKTVTFIVPKTNVYEAWVIGMDISEINLKQPEPQFTTLLPHIDGEPFTAGNSKKHGLLIGLKNRKSIKLLQEMTGTLKRTSVMYKLISHIPAHSQHLSAICTVSTPEKDKDIAVFLHDYHLTGSKEKGAVIRWYSGKKLKTNELNISNNVEIENPVYMDEFINGNICITCAPDDKSSWIQLLDKHGNHKIRYPPKDEMSFEENIVYSFIGAGFMRDGRITILDRVSFRQHLLDDNGKLIRIDHYQNQPSSFAVDIHDNIWIGFDDGTVQVMEYKDGWYEDIEING